MRRKNRRLGWSLAAFGALLGPAVGRVEAQKGGGGGHVGGGGGPMAQASGGMMRGGMAGPSGGMMHGGIKNYGYGYRPGYGNYGYNNLLGAGFGYPYYGGYGFGYPSSGYGGFANNGYGDFGYGFGYASGPGTFSGVGYQNALANPMGFGASGPGTFSGVGYENALANPGGYGASGPGTFVSPYAAVGNYGPTAFAYGTPIAGYGYYGGIGGLGYGGYGGGYGAYGGLGATIGMSPYDQMMLRDQTYAENASRSNLDNAQAAQAYSSANYLNALSNNVASGAAPPQTTGGKPYENGQDGGARAASGPANPTASNHRANRLPDLAPDVILDPEGNLRWPAPAPNDGDLAKDRASLDEAVKKVASDSKANGGRAPIREVVDARDKLYAYGNKAMQEVHAKDQPNAAGVARFLNSLDHALLAMGEGPAPHPTTPANPAAAAAVNKLDNAPKSAGDVLRDSIKDDKPKAPAPDAAPKAP